MRTEKKISKYKLNFISVWDKCENGNFKKPGDQQWVRINILKGNDWILRIGLMGASKVLKN